MVILGMWQLSSLIFADPFLDRRAVKVNPNVATMGFIQESSDVPFCFNL
jgi:hypothetical protein